MADGTVSIDIVVNGNRRGSAIQISLLTGSFGGFPRCKRSYRRFFGLGGNRRPREPAAIPGKEAIALVCGVVRVVTDEGYIACEENGRRNVHLARVLPFTSQKYDKSV